MEEIQDIRNHLETLLYVKSSLDCIIIKAHFLALYFSGNIGLKRVSKAVQKQGFFILSCLDVIERLSKSKCSKDKFKFGVYRFFKMLIYTC